MPAPVPTFAVTVQLVPLPLTPPAVGFQQGIIVQPPDKRVFGIRFRVDLD